MTINRTRDAIKPCPCSVRKFGRSRASVTRCRETCTRGRLPGYDSWLPGGHAAVSRDRGVLSRVPFHRIQERCSRAQEGHQGQGAVLRRRDGKLLVFRHTDYSYEEVGIQVPAGSIRPGESPEAAALREADEETGLSEFKIVRKLGETEYDISPYRFEIQRRHVFHQELTEPTPERWDSQEDHDGEQEPTRFECFWIPMEAPTSSSTAGARCWDACTTDPRPVHGPPAAAAAVTARPPSRRRRLTGSSPSRSAGRGSGDIRRGHGPTAPDRPPALSADAGAGPAGARPSSTGSIPSTVANPRRTSMSAKGVRPRS